MGTLIKVAMLIIMAVLIAMDAIRDSQALLEAAFEEVRFLADDSVEVRDRRLDFIGTHDGKRYFGQVRTAREGRSDRLVPLIAQTVLEVQAHGAHQNIDNLVAIVAAPHINASAARAVIEFGRLYSPDVAVGVFDFDGRRLFSQQDLEPLNADPQVARRPPAAPLNLFSDLNQWMLKVLLAVHLRSSAPLLRSPQSRYRNATELADAAKVTVMSAFRFITLLKSQGFLDDSGPTLEVVRVRELLRLWQASYQRPARDLPVRWLLRSNSPAQLSNTVKAFGDRSCLGLFAAAHAHGFRHVTGVPIHLYVDTFSNAGLERMAVVPVGPGEVPDLILRVPMAKQSVFRGMVPVGRGFRACDILQVWLDVASYPGRGQEQADLIFRKVIEPMLVGLP